jgi:hypothetical protein
MKSANFKFALVVMIGSVVIACSSLPAGILPTDEPPGVGEKAERGYAVCGPIINALEQYRIENGEYPQSLAELAPDYLALIPTRVNDQPIAYMKTGESFSLSFYYIGPGMNACTFTPETQWRCSGAY